MSASPSELEALFKETGLLDRIRSLIKQLLSVKENETMAISLHDCLIRLRIWEKEFFIQGLANFETNNDELAHLVRRHLEEIRLSVEKIEKAVSTKSFEAIK